MNTTAVDNQLPDTREKILDAAEALIIEHGYAGTSLRAIAASADVNLAATNYHFGSKKGLLAAVFHRRIQPLNELRLQRLKDLIKSERSLTIHSIMETFFSPFRHGELPANLPGIIGRLLAEPEALTKPILEDEFSEPMARFLGALMLVLPDVDPDELRWRFHFMIGAMIQMLRIQAPLGIEPNPERFKQGIDQLVDFCVAGIEQRPNP